MLAHYDPAKKSVILISIPRDLFFAMPQYRNPIPKIKTMFYIGAEMHPNQAVQLTVAAVEKFTGMHIDHWVVTDFGGFVDAINAVGGVTVNVPGRLYDPKNSGANLYPGVQTLNGSQALAFVRVRQNTASSAGTSDFARDNYQAQVLSALKQKLLDGPNDLSHIGPLIKTWTKDVRTDMSYSTLLQLASAVRGASVAHLSLATPANSLDVLSAPAPGMNQEGAITGAYYDVVDQAAVYKKLKPLGSKGVFTGVPLPDPSSVPVTVRAGAAYVKDLKAAGYPVNVTASQGGTSRVVVEYPPGHLAWGLKVGLTLGTGNAIVRVGTDKSAVVVLGP